MIQTILANLDVDHLEKLAKVEEFTKATIFFKFRFSKVQEMVAWSGNDNECHDSRWTYGANGVISVVSNLVPGLMHELMFQGKNPLLNSKLMPLIDWLFREPNPIGLNTALAQLGVTRPVFRLPYVPLPLSRLVEFVRIVEAIEGRIL